MPDPNHRPRLALVPPVPPEWPAVRADLDRRMRHVPPHVFENVRLFFLARLADLVQPDAADDAGRPTEPDAA
jgi:hypothetical protein